MTVDFNARAAALQPAMIDRRRDLHQHPELAFEEVRTAGIVADELRRLGLDVQTEIGKTGVVGLLDGPHPGPTVLVRADMDALPIHELNERPYASTVAGKMHACGHDGHTTVGLAVARMLTEQQANLHGCVKFVFQPAEEIAGGAKAMIKDGVLEAPRPDYSLGLHLWNSLPLGKLGMASGPVMAGSDSFKIEITGHGGHGATPHRAIDPVVCAAHLITAFQTVVSRTLDPFESGVVSVTQVHAGHADNVIPQTAILRGTIRAFLPAIRQQIIPRLETIIDHTAAAMGCSASFTLFDGTKPVINDPDVSQRVRDAIRPLVNPDAILLNERTMGAEDMGYFMQDIPGMYFFVGSANADAGLDYGHHHPRFDFDEDVLPLAAALLATAVGAFVLPGGGDADQ